MPLYEYYCEECQKEFTLLQPTSAKKEETICPECDSPRVTPRLSTFSSKIQGVSAASKKKPVTFDELPNTDIFKLPQPRLASDYKVGGAE
ncbi:MAG: zinc ribbon domain-containing protein [Nitrospinaceae bacterium]